MKDVIDAYYVYDFASAGGCSVDAVFNAGAVVRTIEWQSIIRWRERGRLSIGLLGRWSAVHRGS